MIAGTRLERLTPLIVCGRQRAGTRFVANLLNSFEAVTLQGEIPNPVMTAMERFLKEVDVYYEQRGESGRRRFEKQNLTWLRKKGPLVLSLWASVGQDSFVEPGPECRYFGYKRPNNEYYFDFYETCFNKCRPVYVYCIRNFVDNYLSIVSRWPDRSIDQVATEYLGSVRQYTRMKTAAPDRVLLMNLDDHIRMGFDYVERNVLTPLGLPVDQERRAALAEQGPVNRTEHENNRPRRRELTEAELDFLQSRPELKQEFAALSEASQGVG